MASQSTMLVVLFLVLPALVLVEHCAFSLCWPQGKGEKASQPGPAASVPLLVRLAQPAACGSGSPGPPTLVCSTAYDNGCRTPHPGHLAKEVTPGSISAPLPLGISLALTALALSHMLLTFSDISQAVSPWKTGQ